MNRISQNTIKSLDDRFEDLRTQIELVLNNKKTPPQPGWLQRTILRETPEVLISYARVDLHNLVQAIRDGLVRVFQIEQPHFDSLKRVANVMPEGALPIYEDVKTKWETVKKLLGEETLQEDTITHLVSYILLELGRIFVKEAYR